MPVSKVDASQLVPSPHQIILESGQKNRRYWKDIWRYRELFYFLAWRDIAVRYKQTFLGVAWALVQPLASMLVLTFVFGYLAGMNSNSSVPYPLLVLTGVLPWQFFVSILNASSQSLVSSSRLFTKVYFPRLIIPFSVTGVALVDFLISVFLLICFVSGFVFFTDYIFDIRWQLFFLPVFLLLAALTALSLGIWFATLNVKYRDFRIIIPFIVQFGVFITPVGYSSQAAERFPLLTILNPMAQVIDGFRWTILGEETSLSFLRILISLTMVLLILWSGISYFRRVENRMADVI